MSDAAPLRSVTQSENAKTLEASTQTSAGVQAVAVPALSAFVLSAVYLFL
jgi:hypothetical protein